MKEDKTVEHIRKELEDVPFSLQPCDAAHKGSSRCQQLLNRLDEAHKNGYNEGYAQGYADAMDPTGLWRGIERPKGPENYAIPEGKQPPYGRVKK